MTIYQWPNHSEPLGSHSMLQKWHGKINQLGYGSKSNEHFTQNKTTMGLKIGIKISPI